MVEIFTVQISKCIYSNKHTIVDLHKDDLQSLERVNCIQRQTHTWVLKSLYQYLKILFLCVCECFYKDRMWFQGTKQNVG